MIKIDAKERLSKLEFQADEDWDIYPRSEYTCPKCNETIGFNLKDFNRHSMSSFTNLAPIDAEKAEALLNKDKESVNSFLDFYCPGCKSPVRIYYLSWAGGRYTYGVSIKFIIEANENG